MKSPGTDRDVLADCITAQSPDPAPTNPDFGLPVTAGAKKIVRQRFS